MTLSNASLVKKSIKLAWPISLQNILVTLLSMIDVIMVSHLGDTAIAAVGLSNKVIFVVQIIVFGLAWGVGVLSAQYFGSGKTSKIRVLMLGGCILAWVALIPVLICNYYFADVVLGLGSSDQALIALGQSYLWITMPSMLFLSVIMVFENGIRSINHVRIPLLFSSAAIVINIILNYWLINGGLGIEAMGVDGAAWATTIARLFHLTLLIYVLFKIKHVLRVKRLDLQLIRSGAKHWLKIINLVWPMMVSFGTWALGSFTYQLIYGQVGTRELAVMSLLTPIEGTYISLFFGFAAACSIMVSQQLGASRFDQAWRIVKGFIWIAPAGALLYGLSMILFQDVVFILFGNLPAQTLAMADKVYIIIALAAWLKVINLTISMGALRAGGDNTANLLIDIFCMWIISIPLTIYVAFYLKMPLAYVVIAALSEEIFKCVLFLWRLNTKKWLRNLTKTT